MSCEKYRNGYRSPHFTEFRGCGSVSRMLKLLRKKTRLIVWAVVASFALWGGYSVSTQFQKEGRLAGEVSGKPVSLQEYDRFFRANQIFSFTGKPVKDLDILRIQTWQNILYSREAKRLGITVTDEEVRQELVGLLAKVGLGNPSEAQYQQWLSTTFREQPRRFEEMMRDMIGIQKLVRQVMGAPVNPPSEEQIKKQFDLENNWITFKIRYFESEKEAHDAQPDLQKNSSWEAAATDKAMPANVKTYESTPLRDLIRIFQIDETVAQGFMNLEKNQNSLPVASGNGWAVVRIVDKKAADPVLLEEWKKNYLDQLAYRNYVQWSMELRKQADLKDYLPKSERLSDADVPDEPADKQTP